jgi:hypothetical protein
MPADTLLIVRTALHRYAIRRSVLIDVKLVPNAAALAAGGLYDRPCLGVELGPLLDSVDHSVLVRRRALVVTMRRRYIALLVDDVDAFLEQGCSITLPALLRERLVRPWSIGALLFEDEVIVELDVRAVVRDALAHR